MKFFKRNGQPMPKHIVEMADSVKGTENAVNRREFLALASVFGATAATAYAMIGLPTPARAADTPKKRRHRSLSNRSAWSERPPHL